MRNWFTKSKPRPKHPYELTIRVTLDDKPNVDLVNDLTAYLADELGGMTPEGREKGSILLGEDVRLLRQDTEETLRKGVLVMKWLSLTEKGASALEAVAPEMEHLRAQP
ncbi:MAG TPA: hypothetical protein V6D05_12960 [Stenomitos sp.]